MPTQQILNPVILPIIRRVMPSIIAQDLIGVQPMTGPTGQIFRKRGVFFSFGVSLTKVHHAHFVRVYNRRKRHDPEYLTNLGYQNFKISASNVIRAEQWCRSNLKSGSYVRYHDVFWFAHDRDAMMFSLVWC